MRQHKGSLGAIALLFFSQLSIARAPLLLRLSTDPYSFSSSQHQTLVEPSSFSFGSTIVTAFQAGRIIDGGAANIGFASSQDGGANWTNGFLTGITLHAGGSFDRASDPSVAYSAKFDTWLISSLAIKEIGNPVSLSGDSVMVSLSIDQGIHWSQPMTIAQVPGADHFFDKNWTVCDNWPNSPHYGNCYTQWDDAKDLTIYMSTSLDGGQSWGPALTTQDFAKGIGGQPIVLQNGRVVVPIALPSFLSTDLAAFISDDGGTTWSKTLPITTLQSHQVAGTLRVPTYLSSAALDSSGTLSLVWSDCRFKTGCAANDLLITTTKDGISWSQPARIPLSPANSAFDLFIPGLGSDMSSDPKSPVLGLTYYYYPQSNCDVDTCELMVGFSESLDGGQSWSQPMVLGGPMKLNWLAQSSHGFMVGDYISTSFVNQKAFPVFSLSGPPQGQQLDQSIFTLLNGIEVKSALNALPVETQINTLKPAYGTGTPGFQTGIWY